MIIYCDRILTDDDIEREVRWLRDVDYNFAAGMLLALWEALKKANLTL